MKATDLRVFSLVKKNKNPMLILLLANSFYARNVSLHYSLFLVGGMMVFKIYIWDICEFRS